METTRTGTWRGLSFPQRRRRTAAFLLATAAAALLGAAGCVRAPVESRRGPLFFPPPPAPARVQYLGSISTPADLPRQRSRFADFILGPEPVFYPLVKPINAVLSGSKIYVCDTVLNTVLVYDLNDGSATPLAGDRGNGKIEQPNNIAIDDQGRIYVADKLRAAILVYGPDGQFIDAWGRPGEAEPVAVAVGREALYVSDIKNHDIEVWDRANGKLLKSFGGHGSGPGQFIYPTQLALDGEGNLFVTDTGNSRIQKFSPGGQFLMQFGGFGDTLGKFAWPKGMDVDSHGRVYVADSRFANVQIFDPQGRLLLFFGGPGPDRGNLDLPAGLRVYPWPAIPWLTERVAPGFDPEILVLVVSQKGEGMLDFLAVAREPSPGIPGG